MGQKHWLRVHLRETEMCLYGCMYFNEFNNTSTDLYAGIYKMNAGSRKFGEKTLDLKN